MTSRPVLAVLTAVVWSHLCVHQAMAQDPTAPVNYEQRLAKHFAQHGHESDPQKLSPEHFLERCHLMYMASEYRYLLRNRMRGEKKHRAYDRVRIFMKLLRSGSVKSQLVKYRDLEKNNSQRDRLTTLIVRIEIAPFDTESEWTHGYPNTFRVDPIWSEWGVWGGQTLSWTRDESVYQDEFVYGDLRIRSTERAFEIILKDGQQPYRIPKTLVQGIDGVSLEGPAPFSEDVKKRWQDPDQAEYRKLLSTVYRFGKAANQEQVLETVLDIVPEEDVMNLLLLAEACNRTGIYKDGVEFTDTLAGVKSKVMSISTKREQQEISTIQPWELLQGIDADDTPLSSRKRSFMPYLFERRADKARGYYYHLTTEEHDLSGRLNFIGVMPDPTSGTHELLFQSLQEGLKTQYRIDPAAIKTLKLDATENGLNEK